MKYIFFWWLHYHRVRFTCLLTGAIPVVFFKMAIKRYLELQRFIVHPLMSDDNSRGRSSDDKMRFLWMETFPCNTWLCLTALIWRRETVLGQMKWVVNNICIFTALSFCISAALKALFCMTASVFAAQLLFVTADKASSSPNTTFHVSELHWITKQHIILNFRVGQRCKNTRER